MLAVASNSRRDPFSEVVIFPRPASFLNNIKTQIEQGETKFVQINGTLSAQKGDAGMTALESDPDSECRILLDSLSAYSVGLDLVATDTVILANFS